MFSMSNEKYEERNKYKLNTYQTNDVLDTISSLSIKLFIYYMQLKTFR